MKETEQKNEIAIENVNSDKNTLKTISIVTIYKDFYLKDEIINFIKQKGYNVELDSSELNGEDPRLIILINDKNIKIDQQILLNCKKIKQTSIISFCLNVNENLKIDIVNHKDQWKINLRHKRVVIWSMIDCDFNVLQNLYYLLSKKRL